MDAQMFDWRDLDMAVCEEMPPCEECGSQEVMAVVGKDKPRAVCGCLDCGAIWKVDWLGAS